MTQNQGKITGFHIIRAGAPPPGKAIQEPESLEFLPNRNLY